MRVIAIVLSLQIVAALQIKSRSSMLRAVEDQMQAEADTEADDMPICEGCKYAYITMYINEEILKQDRPAMYKEHTDCSAPVKVSAGDAHGICVNTGEQPLAAFEDKFSLENSAAQLWIDAGISKMQGGYTNAVKGSKTQAILELARNLKGQARSSTRYNAGTIYPLVVLTNDLAFKTKLESLSDTAEYPKIVPVFIDKNSYQIPQCTMRKATIAKYQMVKAFGMTEYNKLMYLDPNIRVHDNTLDDLFKENGSRFGFLNTTESIFFMRDFWSSSDSEGCNPDPRETVNGMEVKSFSTSAMLFKPSHEVLESIQGLNNDGAKGRMKDCPSTEAIMRCVLLPKTCTYKGTEENMRKAIDDKSVQPPNKTLKMLPKTVINYQQCFDERKEEEIYYALEFGSEVGAAVGNQLSFMEMPKEDM